MFKLKLDYREFVLSLAEAIIDITDTNLVLIPHTYGPPGGINSDPDGCKEVYDALIGKRSGGRLSIVDREYDASQLKWIIGRCDIFIGSRLHSCIASLSQGIKTIGVAYSRKFKGLFESLGFSDWIVDARELDHDTALAKTLVLIVESHLRKEEQMEAVGEAKRNIYSLFRTLIYRNYVDDDL